MRTNASAPREFTGRHMALVMVLFFGTIISVNLTMAYFANSSWSGLVVENSYVASQHFDAVTRAREAEQARGWTLATDYADGVITVDLKDEAGKPLYPKAITATVGHPVNGNFDREVTFSRRADGLYAAETDLTPGRWEAKFTVEARDLSPWHQAVRFSVR
ncbi:FixH family protein [Jiella marina]|uniref:FixH family protein n=1 Tax=Jiella sp. LLJ827 TaxID=2917712 RepID=UPI002101A8DB|nr:FixH family protein [Jiella sp. LLJ827]MCQ0988537.1 FixH family protein [Jiella sp. LLJ827]